MRERKLQSHIISIFDIYSVNESHHNALITNLPLTKTLPTITHYGLIAKYGSMVMGKY